MATAAAAVQADAAAGEGGKSGRKKLLLLAVPVALVLAGAGLWFTGVLPRLLGIAQPAAHSAATANAAGHGVEGAKATDRHGVDANFVVVPDIIANLDNGQRRAVYIKLRARIELARPEDALAVTAAMPRIQDLFQTYLREMRPEEMRGSAGTYRLREELIARANIAVAPARIQDLLFMELLIQ
jgi:flagellar protein FliL